MKGGVLKHMSFTSVPTPGGDIRGVAGMRVQSPERTRPPAQRPGAAGAANFAELHLNNRNESKRKQNHGSVMCPLSLLNTVYP